MGRGRERVVSGGKDLESMSGAGEEGWRAIKKGVESRLRRGRERVGIRWGGFREQVGRE